MGKCKMADRQGFEPWRRSPAYTLSKRAPSTTRPPVLIILTKVAPRVSKQSARFTYMDSFCKIK